MTVKEKELEEYREIVQKIIDKYISQEKRFSVKNFSQEGLYDLVSLLLEKDEKKRENLWKILDRKKTTAIKRFNKAEIEFLKENAEMENKKEEYDRIFGAINELAGLSKNIDADIELQKHLEND